MMAELACLCLVYASTCSALAVMGPVTLRAGACGVEKGGGGGEEKEPALVLCCAWDLGTVVAGSTSGTLWHGNNRVLCSFGLPAQWDLAPAPPRAALAAAPVKRGPLLPVFPSMPSQWPLPLLPSQPSLNSSKGGRESPSTLHPITRAI